MSGAWLRVRVWSTALATVACGGDDAPPGTTATTGGGDTVGSTGATGGATGGATEDGRDASGSSSAGMTETGSGASTTFGGGSGTSGSGSGTGSGSGSSGSGSSDSGSSDSGSSDSGTSDSGTSDSGTSDSGSSTGVGVGVMACVDVDLGGAIAAYAGTTAPLADDHPQSCAPGTRDAAHRFAAPATGYYTFSTAGSSFDTVLSLLDGDDCGAPEVACDDDVSLADPSSRVTAFRAAGESMLVVVDGFSAGQSGDYILDVDAVLQACPDDDLGSALPATLVGDTNGDFDKLSPSCVSSPGRDRVVVWQAPAEGTYQVDTLTSSFDTVLHVRDGLCSFDELACDDDSEGTPQSLVELDLLAGQVITIVVDGFDADEFGAFTLSITEQ